MMSKLLAVLLLVSSTQASAAAPLIRADKLLVIRADATGTDAGSVPAFWGVQFLSGDGYIRSVRFSLPSPLAIPGFPAWLGTPSWM
jgi:hypothetical protein